MLYTKYNAANYAIFTSARYCTDKYETTIWLLPAAVKIKILKFVVKIVLYTVSRETVLLLFFK